MPGTPQKSAFALLKPCRRQMTGSGPAPVSAALQPRSPGAGFGHVPARQRPFLPRGLGPRTPPGARPGTCCCRRCRRGSQPAPGRRSPAAAQRSSGTAVPHPGRQRPQLENSPTPNNNLFKRGQNESFKMKFKKLKTRRNEGSSPPAVTHRRSDGERSRCRLFLVELREGGGGGGGGGGGAAVARPHPAGSAGVRSPPGSAPRDAAEPALPEPPYLSGRGGRAALPFSRSMRLAPQAVCPKDGTSQNPSDPSRLEWGRERAAAACLPRGRCTTRCSLRCLQ